jgi:mono/diheme cytochrome c family protein
MKPIGLILILLAITLGLTLAILAHPGAVKALPEYASQTGEPCATCHLSPSGGGPRGPRGQAWVGSGKPMSVPSLVDSLDLLGVKLESDPKDYQASGQPAQPAQPLQIQPSQTEEIHEWLKEYDGN